MPAVLYCTAVQRKIFWLLFITTSVVAEIMLPFVWGLVATLALVILCWWIVYRSGWFE